jgi:hypothetical protein
METASLVFDDANVSALPTTLETVNAPFSEPEDWLSSNSCLGFICLVIMVFLTEFGNGLTIASFATQRRLRRIKYIPVVSLAVSDSLFGLTAVLFHIERQHYVPEGSRAAFSLSVLILCSLFANASAWHLIVMAVDRFIAVRFPMCYRRAMTSRRIAALTVGGWLMAAVIMAPYVSRLSPGARSPSDTNATCYQFGSDDGPVPLPFDFAIQFTDYVLTSIILAALNVGVLAAARRTPKLSRFRGCGTPSIALCGWRRRLDVVDDDNDSVRRQHTEDRLNGTRRIGQWSILRFRLGEAACTHSVSLNLNLMDDLFARSASAPPP